MEGIKVIEILENAPSIRLLNNMSEVGSFIAFETDIIDVTPLITKSFKMAFITDRESIEKHCFLKKYDLEEERPIYLLCKMDKEDNSRIKDTIHPLQGNIII